MTKAEVILNAINSGATDEELAVLENTPEEQFTVESEKEEEVEEVKEKTTTTPEIEEVLVPVNATVEKEKVVLNGEEGSEGLQDWRVELDKKNDRTLHPDRYNIDGDLKPGFELYTDSKGIAHSKESIKISQKGPVKDDFKFRIQKTNDKVGEIVDMLNTTREGDKDVQDLLNWRLKSMPDTDVQSVIEEIQKQRYRTITEGMSQKEIDDMHLVLGEKGIAITTTGTFDIPEVVVEDKRVKVGRSYYPTTLNLKDYGYSDQEVIAIKRRKEVTTLLADIDVNNSEVKKIIAEEYFDFSGIPLRNTGKPEDIIYDRNLILKTIPLEKRQQFQRWEETGQLPMYSSVEGFGISTDMINNAVASVKDKAVQTYFERLSNNERLDVMKHMPTATPGTTAFVDYYKDYYGQRTKDERDFKKRYGYPLTHTRKGNDMDDRIYTPINDYGADWAKHFSKTVNQSSSDYIKNTSDRIVKDDEVLVLEIEKFNTLNSDFIDRSNELNKALEGLGKVTSDSSPDVIDNYNAIIGEMKVLKKAIEDRGLNSIFTDLSRRSEKIKAEIDNLTHIAEVNGDLSIITYASGLNYSNIDRTLASLEKGLVNPVGVMGADFIDFFLQRKDGTWDLGSKARQHSIETDKDFEETFSRNLDFSWNNLGIWAPQALANNSSSIAAVGGFFVNPYLGGSLFFGMGYGHKVTDIERSRQIADKQIKSINLKLSEAVTEDEKFALIKQKDDWQRKKDISHWQERSSGILAGGTELIWERLGSVNAIKNMQKWSQVVGRSMFKRTVGIGYGLTLTQLIELGEEVGTQINNNAWDMVVLKENKSFIDGINKDFFANTIITGLALQSRNIGETTWNLLSDQVRTRDQKKINIGRLERISEIDKELQNPLTLNSVEVEKLENEKMDLIEQAGIETVMNIDNLNNLTFEEKQVVFEKARQAQEVLTELEGLGATGDLTSNYAKKNKKFLMDKYNELVGEKDQLLDKKDKEIRERAEKSNNPAAAAYNAGLNNFANNIARYNANKNGKQFTQINDISNLKQSEELFDDFSKILDAYEAGDYAFHGESGNVYIFQENVDRQIYGTVATNTITGEKVYSDNNTLEAMIAAVSPLHENLHDRNRTVGIIKDGKVVESAVEAIEGIEAEMQSLLTANRITQEVFDLFKARKDLYTNKNTGQVDMEELINLVGDLHFIGALPISSFNNLFGLKSLLNNTASYFFPESAPVFKFKTKDIFGYVQSFYKQSKSRDLKLSTRTNDTKAGGTQFSRSKVNLDESKGELHEKIDALTNNAKTKAEFQERTKENGRFSAFENVYTGILDGKFDRIFGRNVDESIKEKQRENLADRLINYDPAKTPELSKWMYGGSGKAGNIRYSGLTALHKQWTEDQNKNKLTSIDTEEAKDVIDMTTSAPDADTEASKPDTKDIKLRDLKDFDVYLDDTFGNELAIAEVNGILSRFENGDISLEKAKSLMTEVTLKDIRAALSESIPKIAKDKASGITKPTPEYESWIRSEYSEIVQSLDIKTIRKYKFFEATVTGKKDYKNINPLTGKVSNFVKPTQVNTTNKREYIRYFLEGKPNDLIERRTALIRRIAERKTSLAVDNYIIDSSNNVEAVILSTMKNLSSTPITTKGEQTSFDTVKFSKSFTAKEIADIEKNGENIIEITTRLERGEPFDLVLLQNVFRDKQGPLREWLSNEFMKRKGLTAEDNMLRDYKLTDDEYAQLEKEAAESNKKIAEANGIDPGRVSLVNVNDNPKLIKQRVDHHIKFLNFMPFHHSKMPSEAITALITELGWNSRSRKEYGKNLNLTNKNKSITIDNYYGANVFLNNGKAYDGRYDACYTPKNFGALKRAIAKEGKRLMEQVKLGNITRVEAEMQYVDFVRGKFSYNGKSSGYDATIKANETLATDFYMARFKAAKAEKPIKVNGVEIDIAKENILVHNAMQSNISTGITKAFVYNLNTVAFEGSKPGTYEFKNKKGEVKEYTTTDELHWEHERQLLNNNEHFFNLVNRHKTASPKMLSELELFIKTSTQSLIEKSLQLENDAQGTTSYGPKYSGNLAEQALLNFLTRKGVENNQLIMSGPYKGMRLSDSLAAKYTVSELEAALSKLPKGTLNSTALTIKAGVKSKSEFKNLETIDTAVKFSRTANPAKGISVLDFDDTLATTKSGVRYTLPNPDGTPQPKKKVIFMAGGPGSGKSNVINQLGLKGQGFKVVNQDISLEWLMKNHGMPTDMREFTPEQVSEFGKLNAQAREIALKKRIKYQGGGDGVIIDGTGASLNVMKKNIQDFKDKGYDVQMIFVETSQETALSRNKARKERSLRTGIVIKTHDSVQANKEAYKELFGERFAEVNTDNLKQGDVMPADVVNKVNDFTSGYIKGRLNAGEYATKGEELRQQGAEFDFSEFNQVVEGKTAPLFNKAMKLQEKFTSKDMFVLTARPAESNQAIFEFLQANGLNIPMENIVGLGSSLSSDKALWMAGKVGEGYNDFYFADDILENVKAVSDMLDQFDVKSKVQQAKRDFVLGDPKAKKLLDEKSMNDVKDVDGLANPGVYSNVKFSKSHRAEYENTVAKNRPDLSGKEITATIDKMFEYIDGLDVPNKRKYEQITTKWLATSNIKLPEDSYKIQQAVEIAELKNEDIFSYKNPNEIIEKYAGTIKVKPISPVGIKEFTRATGFNDPITTEYGIVEYEVEETREAQQKVRDIVNTHWGPNSNPWCITKIDKDGNLSEDAWRDWTSYGKGPKRIVFQNGKLLAMKANYEYWGKMNKHSEGPIIQVKEGNVTNTTELVVGNGGIVDPIIRETRTVSKDGNTVTTNIFEDSQDGYADGTTIVENRIKGVKTKETRFDPDGSKVSTQEFNKKGKPTTSYQFNPNGKVKSINGHLQQQAVTEAGLDVNAREDVAFMPHFLFEQTEVVGLTNELVVGVGDIIENNYTEAGTDYFYGRVLVGDQVMEIGFESKTSLDLADVTKTVNGKTRLDIGKVIREVDPNVKGLPKTGVKFSKGISKEFNDIIEQSTGVGSEKVFSDAQAKIRGNKRRFDNIVPYSVQDLMGLLYNFVGKGKVGEQQMEFFKKALIDPFGRAINELNKSKQSSAGDYSNLTKAFPNVKKKLNKEVEGGDYTYDQAIRVYLWNKAGFEVPGLSKRDLNALDSIVKNDPELQAFADTLGLISKKEEGYAKPGEYWLVENIASDLLSDGSIGDARSEFLAEWQQNADEMFSKENLNKIQAIYGNKFREALEDILYRMKHGTNRPTGSSRLTNNFMNWINNSTGAIMFFNMRSALLQTLSTTNYINWTDNNPLKAAMAFANQKQYWSDFSALFNSDFLKQRRSGNQRSINEAELTTAVANSDNKAKAAIAWLLQKGFLPTQIMDSFAISAGGATFYRNRINKYIKEGMSPEQAQEKAFLDFQEITEATQQSARPDMISQQQASPLGRLILSFQNTPMQYARIMNKAARDIVNGRGDQKSNISKIVYYGAIQSIIFAALQSAIFASLGDDEEEEFDKKKQRIVGSMVDGWLAGLGVAGKAIGTIERSIKEYLKQKERGFNADHAQTIIQLLGFSPPIGSKLRKIYSAIQTEEFNKGVSEKRGFTLDNPTWSSWGNVIEGFTNIPLGRISNKLLNIDNALDSQNQWWERAALLLGWNTWDLGIKDPDIIAVKGEIKEERKVEKKKQAVIKKEEKKQEIKEENISKEEANIELQKKEIEDGNESPDCAAINKRGERCGTKIEKGSTYCTVHTKVEQNDGGKKTQCGKTKKDGKRCKMQTSNKSGYCYYHD
jgi:predicted kinase